jgi:hypothetical protein
MTRIHFLLLPVSILLMQVFPAVASADPLASVDFLIGTWEGASAVTRGVDSFERILGGRILRRTAHATVLGNDGKPVGSMETLMTIHADPAGPGLRAEYFDSDGHVIHYKTAALVPGERVQFVSDGTDPGPMFRLSYLLQGGDRLHVKFEMSPPGHPDAFALVAEGDATRAL